MPAVEGKIWLALKSRIDSLPLSFEKAWPGERFEPPSAGLDLLPYLRIGRVSVEPLPILVEDGTRHTRTGTLIITLVHPLITTSPDMIGRHASVYDEYAGQIAVHFSDGVQMHYDDVCVKVVSAPHVQPGFDENGYWQMPVSIPWRTFA